MNRNVIYVGLNVDDTQHHGSALDKDTGEVITFQCRPTLVGLVKQLTGIEYELPRLCRRQFILSHAASLDSRC